MRSAERAARDAQIVAALKDGKKQQAVADEFGITRERVRQIGVDHGVATSYRSKQAAVNREMVASAAKHAKTAKEIAAKLGRSTTFVYEHLSDEDRERLDAGTRRQVAADARARQARKRRTTDEELLEELRECARALGETPSRKAFDRWYGKARGQVHGLRFGSWNAAIEAAGFEPRTRSRIYERQFTHEDLVDALRRAYAQEPYGVLSIDAYEALREPTDPSAAIIRQRLGCMSWAAALEAAEIPPLAG